MSYRFLILFPHSSTTLAKTLREEAKLRVTALTAPLGWAAFRSASAATEGGGLLPPLNNSCR